MAKKSLIGNTFAETYFVEEELGAGGMGTVYIARNVRLGKRYALKVLNPDVANTYPGAVDRFKREAVTAGRLGHVGIVQVHDISQTDDGLLYMVMDLLEGEDLEGRMIDEGLLTWEFIYKTVTQTCDALATAHEAGIVHRDLKPANIFLSKRKGEGERAVLLDFGVAKVLDAHRQIHPEEGDDETISPPSTPTLTKPGTIVGTPNYMSPEQASGIGVDHRADVYSMGAVLYHMAAGKPPFDADSLLAVLTMIAIDPVPTSYINADEIARPPGLDEIIAKAMAKKKENRFQDIRDLARALPVPGSAGVAVGVPVSLGTTPASGLSDDTIDQPSTLEMYAIPNEGSPPDTIISQQISIDQVQPSGVVDASATKFDSVHPEPSQPSGSYSGSGSVAAAAPPRRGMKSTWMILIGLLLAGVIAGSVAALAPSFINDNGGSNVVTPPPPPPDEPSKEVQYSRGVADVERAMESENWGEAAGLLSNLGKRFPQREASLRSMREQIDVEMASSTLHRNAKTQFTTNPDSARQLCAQIRSNIYRERPPCKELLKAPVPTPPTKGDAGPDAASGKTPGKVVSARPRRLSDPVIMRVVRQNRGRAMRCFDRAFEGGYRPIGSVRVSVRLSIAPSGRVTSASLLDSRHPTTASFRVCIENAVRRWEFPEALGSTTTEVPFTYRAPEIDLDNI